MDNQLTNYLLITKIDLRAIFVKHQFIPKNMVFLKNDDLLCSNRIIIKNIMIRMLNLFSVKFISPQTLEHTLNVHTLDVCLCLFLHNSIDN